jgi:multiple sugar transport system substrate-binding protein
MMSAKPKEEANAKALLSWFGSKEAADIMVKQAPTTLVANSGADVSGYTALQKKAADIVGSAGSIAQFLDRDTRPDFASTVMIPALQDYIKDPAKVGDILSSVEAQKKSIFGS